MQDTERMDVVVEEPEDRVTVRTPAVAPPRLAMGTRELPPFLPAARLVGDDLAEIVHDLKTPINTVMLELWVLEDRSRVDLPRRELRAALARMNHNLIYLDRMVQDLLDVCAAEAGKLALRTRLVDLRQVVSQVVARSVTARDQHRVSLQPGDGILLYIDDLRIERVIANLVSNALVFAPASTSVLVQIEVLAMVVRVSVVDAGPGLSDDEVAHVFDRYGRTESARGCDGHGLGLCASRRIVEAHGGQLGVESIAGAGSRFFFDLPATARGVLVSDRDDPR